ncbi:hypothetical protein KOXY103107_16125 [Komagataeibacter xylinus]
MVLSHLLGCRRIRHALGEGGIRGIATVRQFDARQKQGQGRGETRGREDFAPARRVLCLGQTLPCQLVDAGVQRGLRPPVGAEDPDIAQHDRLSRSEDPWVQKR